MSDETEVHSELSYQQRLEALRRTNKKGQNYEGFPSPPMAADSEGGGKWVNRASDFMVIHRYSQHPEDWMYSHLHVRKVKEMETGGRPTPMEEPIVLRSKPGNNDVLITFWSSVRGLRMDTVRRRRSLSGRRNLAQASSAIKL